MRAYMTMLGCRLNEAEVETWSRHLCIEGHEMVCKASQAQVIVVNTCAVTAEAARKSRKLIAQLHRQNPTAKLVLTGCYTQLEPAKAAALMGVDLVVSNQDKDRLPELLEKLDLNAMPEMAEDPDGDHIYQSKARTRAFIKVQDGCRNRCTFCIVTIARGEERSRPVQEIIDEINGLHQEGYEEAVLTGVHLGGYGRDLDTSLFALMEKILANTEIPRLRLSSLEPWDLPEGFWSLWDNPRLLPHLHLPLQSGSNTVLKRMARRCNTASYAEMVRAAREAIPHLSVTTDWIVGFPGESEEEWRESVAFAELMRFSHMHIFSYSAREGTTAARMPNQVRNDLKKSRSREMHQIAADSKRMILENSVGQVREVLWEGKGVPTGERTLEWSGYTDNYLRVFTKVPRSVNLENQITDAKILCVEDSGNAVSAKVLSFA